MAHKIETLSHPGADRSIGIEGLKNYCAVSRRYRDRRIGEFLKELHLTEGRNTGFQIIIRVLRANGFPMPVFETDDDRTYFLTTITIHRDFLVSSKSENEHENDTVNGKITAGERLVLNAIYQKRTSDGCPLFVAERWIRTHLNSGDPVGFSV